MFLYLILNFFALLLASWIVIKFSKRNFEFQVKQLCFNMPISIPNDSIVEYIKAISQTKKAFFAIGLEAIQAVEHIEKIDHQQIYRYIESKNNINVINFNKLPKDVSIVVTDTIDKKQQDLLLYLTNMLHQNNKNIFIYITMFNFTSEHTQNRVQFITNLLINDVDSMIIIQNKNDLLYHIKNTRILLANWCEIPFFIYLDQIIFTAKQG